MGYFYNPYFPYCPRKLYQWSWCRWFAQTS